MSTALPPLESTESTFTVLGESMVSFNCPVYWKAPGPPVSVEKKINPLWPVRVSV